MVIDDSAATALDIALGDEVEVMGRTWRVSGLTTGMTSIVNTSVYVTFDDLATVLGWPDTASYILIGSSGDPEAVAASIEAAVSGVSTQTRQRFSAEERAVVKEMSTDLLNIMSLAAFLVGLAVIGLVLYAAVLSRLRDIGVMKALGLGRLGVSRLIRSLRTLRLGHSNLALLKPTNVRWCPSRFTLGEEGQRDQGLWSHSSGKRVRQAPVDPFFRVLFQSDFLPLPRMRVERTIGQGGREWPSHTSCSMFPRDRNRSIEPFSKGSATRSWCVTALSPGSCARS